MFDTLIASVQGNATNATQQASIKQFCTQVLDDCDLSHDDKISKDEFHGMVLKHKMIQQFFGLKVMPAPETAATDNKEAKSSSTNSKNSTESKTAATTSTKKTSGSTGVVLQAVESKTNFSAQKVAALKAIFDKHAKKNVPTNVLNKVNFTAAMADAGLADKVSNDKITKLFFDACDTGENDYLTFFEYCMGLSYVSSGSASERLGFAFNMCDNGNTGEITVDELVGMLRAVKLAVDHKEPTKTACTAEATAMLAANDVNKSKSITRDEFLKLFKSSTAMQTFFGLKVTAK
jgi:Ca2+-binding EF-hand superfamily protein